MQQHRGATGDPDGSTNPSRAETLCELVQERTDGACVEVAVHRVEREFASM